MPALCQALFFSKQLERQQIGWLPAIWVFPTAPGMFCGWVHRGRWSPFSAALGLMGNILQLPGEAITAMSALGSWYPIPPGLSPRPDHWSYLSQVPQAYLKCVLSALYLGCSL